MSGMTRCWRRWCWKLAIPFGIASLHASLVCVGGTIADFGDCAIAQITPDDTLGAESSVVTPNVVINGLPSDQIDGGAIRGTNLFHSFQQFNIDEGRGAYFTNPAGIENILSRVTGGNPSNILGTLGVSESSANLFLINPNGIIFGRNASLDVGGSFVATTTNAIQFGNQGFFSATDPNVPPLLTVNPSAFLFNQIAAQPINSIENRAFLPVPDSRSLLLVGGNVSPNVAETGGILIDGGFLQAPGGRVDLGGVAGAGTVGLNVEGNNLSLSFRDDVARADVSLTNGAFVDITAGGGGSIAINARNLNVLGESVLFAGIASGQGSVDTQAGDIMLNATGTITVAGNISIFNSVGEEAVGKGGNINIQAGSLSLDNARLSTGTFGRGDSGSVSVQADDSVSVTNSRIFSIVGEDAVGKGGDINIQAGSFSLDNNALMITSTFGVGDAGSVSVQVVDSVSLANGSIDSSVYPEAVGNGAVINIQARSLSLSDDSGLSTTTFGRGNAGGVSVQAVNSLSIANSSIDSSVYSGAVGKGGNIDIQTRSVSLNDDSGVSTTTSGQGDAGSVLIQASDSLSLVNSDISSQNIGDILAVGEEAVGKGGDINILTGSLSLSDDSALDTSTLGRGNAGSVFVQADNSVSLANSFINSSVYPEAVGNGGEINIQARSLSLTNSAKLSTDTFGRGDAGSVSVQADDSVVLVNGSINSDVLPGAVGRGGNIDIQAKSLSLSDDSELVTSTNGQGDGGSVLIQASNSVSILNSKISSGNYGDIAAIGEVAVGKGGDINILTGSLSFDKAFLNTGTYGLGDAGSVFIRANGPVSFTTKSTILSAVTGSAFLETAGLEAVGKGGNINILAESLSLADETGLITATSGQGNAGDIFVQTNDFVSITGDSLITSAVERSGVGNSGDIEIQARSLSLTGGSQLRAAVENELNNLPGGQGEGGNIRINATETVNLSGLGSRGVSSGLQTITEQGASGQAGDITVNTGAFRIADGAVVSAQTLNPSDGGTITINANAVEAANGGQVLTTTYDRGRAGNITVNAPDSITISGRDPTFAARVAQFGGVNNEGSASGLFAGTQGAGTAGNLTIATGQLIVRDGARVSASTAGQGPGGTLQVSAPRGLVQLIGSGSRLTTETQGAREAGNLTITTGQLLVQDGAQVTVSGREGQAGSLTATADSIRLDQGKLTAVTGAGSGGNIGLQIQDLLLMHDNSLISAEALGAANGGNINIKADFIAAIPSENSDITANAFRGNGGRVDITASGIFGLQYRNRLTIKSDITASSEFGLDGVVEINTPDVDPSRGLANLPEAPVPEGLIAQGCPADKENTFTITGRGGLPPQPGEALRTSAVVVNGGRLEAGVENRSESVTSTPVTHSTHAPLVEAQGWVINAQGQVVLTAHASTVTPNSSKSTPPTCHAS